MLAQFYKDPLRFPRVIREKPIKEQVTYYNSMHFNFEAF